MTWTYDLVKLVHILLAIVAVGANATYGTWIGRTSAKTPESLPHVLRTIKFLDDRVANPCYFFLLVSGAVLVELGGWAWTTRWILAALGLYLIMVVLGLGLFTPALKKQIKLLAERGFGSPEYQAAARRTTVGGIAAMIPALLLLVLMVTKPSLGA